MAIVNRWYQILQLMVTHNEMTVNQLQNKLETSSQTIRKSIDTLNEELIGIAQIVQEKNRFSILIDDFDQFDEVMAGSLKYNSDFNSASKRIAFIIKQLIDAEDFILIDDLSEKLDVSRGTVAKDFREMKKMMNSLDVQVIGTPNRGMRIKGSEFDIRLLHVHFVQEYCEEVFLDKETCALIQKVTYETGIGKHQGVILRKVISIMMQRILLGHELTELPQGYENLVQESEWIEQLIVHLEIQYYVTLSHVEKEFLSFVFNTQTNELEKKGVSNEKALRNYFNFMMQEINNVLLVVDIDEEALFREMKDHLRFMINRLIFRIELQDLFYGEIKKQYPFAYELAKVGLKRLGKIFHREVPSVEYSYLALYFELALRSQTKAKKKKELAVVCSTGKGTALIIHRQLEKILGKDIKISHFSEEEYENEDLNQYFAIFTTVPLKNIAESIPIIQLSNIFDDQYLHQEWERAKQARAAEMKELSLHFHLLNNKRKFHENILNMIQELQRKGLVDQQFDQRIFEREEKNSTIFGSGISFPHALNTASKKIILSVGIFPEAFETSEGIVEVVFMLAIPENLTIKVEKELLHLYDNFFAVVGNKKLRAELCQQKDLVSLKKWMKGQGVI